MSELLRNITELSAKERWNAALDLWVARNKTSNLKRELPIPAEGYANPLKAYRRLGRIAKNAGSRGLLAFGIVRRKGEEASWNGMATLMAGVPNPQEGVSDYSAEVSYWHADKATPRAAFILGTKVVESLISKNTSVPAEIPIEEIWMVTLPDDHIKEDVCLRVGFEPVNDEPRRFDIEDRVTEPRQLWSLKVA